jgi:hypothetical protein
MYLCSIHYYNYWMSEFNCICPNNFNNYILQYYLYVWKLYIHELFNVQTETIQQNITLNLWGIAVYWLENF